MFCLIVCTFSPHLKYNWLNSFAWTAWTAVYRELILKGSCLESRFKASSGFLVVREALIVMIDTFADSVKLGFLLRGFCLVWGWVKFDFNSDS